MSPGSAWAYQKGVLWAWEMPSAGGEDTTPTRSIVPRIAATFEESFDSDAESIAATMGISNPKQVIRRLSLNRRCFVAKADGEIIAYGWASTERECVGEMGRQINLRPDEAYVWDCVTLPAFRRQRLYSALLSHIKSALVDDGYRRIWIGSNLENVPSIRGFAIAGYRPAAIITHLRIASLDFLWVSAAREAGPQLATAARDAFSMASDRKFGSLVIGRVKPADLSACIELDD